MLTRHKDRQLNRQGDSYVTGWFMLYFVIHVLSSYHIVHGIPAFSFHYLITHAAPHFIYTPNLTCFEFPALHG